MVMNVVIQKLGAQQRLMIQEIILEMDREIGWTVRKGATKPQPLD
jgi:hypothetical protein